jgi:serine/threonine-protein kinase
VHGASLRDVVTRANVEKGGMPLALKCRVIADAASGLDSAHHAKSPSGRPLGLIHRDISPQNIMVGYNGGIELIDFGIAKAAGKVSHTMTGAIKGKYAYMSPEQALGEELDKRSDVFGLGIVFFEILTGQRAFKKENDTATLRAVVDAKIASPSSLVKGMPRALDAIVLKALAKKRFSARYQTAGELALSLEDFLVRQRMVATPSHFAAFMRSLYPESADEPFIAEEPKVRSPSKSSSRSGRGKSNSRE